MLEETYSAHNRLCSSNFSDDILCDHLPWLTRASRLLRCDALSGLMWPSRPDTDPVPCKGWRNYTLLPF
jgi:hypothetical protein